MHRKKIGFLINPIAGMGGRVGLKGTDGEAYTEALRKGAKPVAPQRALEFLNSIRIKDFDLIVAPGIMGYNIVEKTSLVENVVEIVGEISIPTSADDTIRIARMMANRNIDLIVFVGGDGTARDIYRAVNTSVPVLGVPSGVKMFSSVFAINPRVAARVLDAFIEGRTVLAEREVFDIDEEAYRKGKLLIKLYGYLKVPMISDYIQSSKSPSLGLYDEEENKKAIARRIVEEMEPDTLYILGPGTTVKAIADLLGIPKTLLGVDAVLNKRLVGKDLDEKAILELLNRYPRAKIIITPIGGQGFIFGRGNQQISPVIIKRIGKNNIIVIATRNKVRELKKLRVDTGDVRVDDMLRGYIRVIIDYNEDLVMKVE